MTRLTPADLSRPLYEISAERYRQGRLERGRTLGQPFEGVPLLEAAEDKRATELDARQLPLEGLR